MKNFGNDLSKREKGLIIIVILAVIGVGIYAWRMNKDKQAKVSINSFSDCVAANNPVAESYPEQCFANGKSYTNSDQVVNETPTEDDNYFEINELGVKFKTDQNSDGLYYYIDPEKPNIAYFSLTELKDTDCAAEETAQVALAKFTEADKADPLNGITDATKKIDEFYYVAQGGQAMCSEDREIQMKAENMTQSVLDAVESSLVSID